MKSDEGFSDMSDKSILNQLVNENVIPIKLTNLKKAAFLQPFFWAFFPHGRRYTRTTELSSILTGDGI